MKWFKKHKEEIISCVQFFIVMYTMLNGFWFSYLMIWFNVGLPTEAWSILVTLVLAFRSLLGLCHWINKENDNG